MDIQIEKHNGVSGTITVNIAKADYEEKVAKSLKTLGQRIELKGFRKGHVPASLVKKMYGVQAKADEINKLLQDSLFNYIKENKVNILGEPMGSESGEAQDIEAQDDFTFAFDVALAPEFEISLSDKDTIDYYDIEVTDEMISNQLTALQQQAGHAEAADEYQPKDILRGTLAELDETGSPKEGGLVIETASLMPEYFKSDDQKKIFEKAKKNDVITFNPATAYDGNEAELMGLYKVERDEVANHKGDFSFQVNEISRFVPATLDQTFFDGAFGKDAVKTEEEAKAKIKESIQGMQTNDSDYKFLLDVRAYCEGKVGQLAFADDLLKKIMKANNPNKDDKFVEDNYAKSTEELRWHLIKEKLVEQTGIKVEDGDVKKTAISAARFQFAQYGMNNIPEEYLENYASEMLKNKDQVNALIERTIDQKLSVTLKEKVTLNHKSISTEDFAKMFENK